ncbi:hypothetical protein B0H10DRAFT_1961401 [Mycena sp. CBHHK59/15]|nr:hypothetical protein B0H10DRAFT_1961401 [Mycena sp. CBHHK59/15]
MSETERDLSPALHRVTLVPGWLDDIVTSTDFDSLTLSDVQRARFAGALFSDRMKLKPFRPDRVDQTVDNYNLNFILKPATDIAGLKLGKDMQVTFGHKTGGVITDCDGQNVTEENRLNYIVAEDKHSLVWLDHEDELLELTTVDTFPTFLPHETPPGEVRIFIDLGANGQVSGLPRQTVISVRRGTSRNHLEFSRVYHDLDGDVWHTACLIIEGVTRPTGNYSMSTSTLLPPLPEICPYRRVHFPPGFVAWFIFHTIFSEHIGAGVSCDVRQSSDGEHVIKIFEGRSAAQNEARILSTRQRHSGLAVPTFRGLYFDGRRFGVATFHAGAPISSLRTAARDQR